MLIINIQYLCVRVSSSVSTRALGKVFVPFLAFPSCVVYTVYCCLKLCQQVLSGYIQIIVLQNNIILCNSYRSQGVSL